MPVWVWQASLRYVQSEETREGAASAAVSVRTRLLNMLMCAHISVDDQRAQGARVLARGEDGGDDGVGVLAVDQVEIEHGFRVGRAVLLEERFIVGIDAHDGFPARLVRAVADEGVGDIEDTRARFSTRSM